MSGAPCPTERDIWYLERDQRAGRQIRGEYMYHPGRVLLTSLRSARHLGMSQYSALEAAKASMHVRHLSRFGIDW